MLPALPRERAPPVVTMISTLSRTNSAAISSKRSLRPSAQRYSIATVRPSIQPSSRSRCTKAAVQWLQAEGRRAPRNPMVGSLPGCCARAASGHAAARRTEHTEKFAPSHVRPQSSAECIAMATTIASERAASACELRNWTARSASAIPRARCDAHRRPCAAPHSCRSSAPDPCRAPRSDRRPRWPGRSSARPAAWSFPPA